MFGVGMTLDTMVTAIAPGLLGFLGDHWGLATSFRWMLLPLGAAATLFMVLRFSVSFSGRLKVKRQRKG
jgi:hypothetical protein